MRFELKKIFSKMSSKIGLILIVIFVMYSVSIADYLVWINEDGIEVTGRDAAKKFYQEEKEWYGPLTEEKLADVITQRWSQGNRGIRALLAKAFGGLDNTDSTIVDSLESTDAVNFYNNRIKSVENYLDSQGNWYTDEEKEFIVTQYKAMKTPLNYQYTKGWSQLFSSASNLQIFLVLVIGFLVAGIFSEEYRTGACSIYFSTANGKDKAIKAKVKAGLFLTTIVYWLAFVLFSALVLCRLGFEGADCSIQISTAGWRSFYNITFLQEYLLIAVGGYIGCLFVASLVMLVSAKTKSTVISVIVPFVVIFVPSVIKVTNSPLAEKIDGLMPYQLVQMNYVIGEFYVYKIMDKFVGAVGFLLILYVVLAVLLQPMIYIVFRKGEA